jgi:hypothetical protein
MQWGIAMMSMMRRAAAFLKNTYGYTNKWQIAIPLPVLYFTAMFLFSSLVMTLETVYFHMLLIVTNYIKATFIISIVMLGIAIGSFIGFYLNRAWLTLVLFLSSVGVMISIVISYYNIINIGVLQYPYLLILPFIFSSVIIAIIFARGHSTRIYFTNLIASALGVIIPIVAVELVKSENTLILSLFVPAAFIGILALAVRDNLCKIALIVVSVVLCVKIASLFGENTAIPERIDAGVFTKKIVAEMGSGAETDYLKNYVTDFFRRVYVKDPATGDYRFAGDAYDRKRAGYFLRVTGFLKRFGVDPLPYIEKRTVIEKADVIPGKVYEKEIIPSLRRQFIHRFNTNEDRKFIDRVYRVNKEGTAYELGGDQYDRLRAKYLLSQLGHYDTYDLNFDVRPHYTHIDNYKWYGTDLRVLLSEDGMLGRIEYLVDERATVMSSNGTALDTMSYSSGPYWDPRMPHLKDPKIFIVGLSADGVAKSGTALENSKVSGIEINPTILRTMSEDGQFSRRAKYPYKGIEVYFGEGRSYLENTKEKYDIITLMNIHTEHGPLCTLGPEYFHTVEGTQLLLDTLTDRGYVTYEEIIFNERGKFFFLKFLNTVKEAMRRNGIAEPEKCIHIFSWDFYEGGQAFRTLTLKRTPFTPEELRYYNGVYLGEIKTKPYYYNVNINYSPGMRTGSEYEKFITGAPVLGYDWYPNNLREEEFIGEMLQRVKKDDDKDFLRQIYRLNNYKRYTVSARSLTPEQKSRLLDICKRSGYPFAVDLRPATDDRPFPFDVYNVKKEIWDILEVILKFSLALFIPIVIIMLYRFRDRGRALFWQFLFAAATGFGFMLVEIVLMQKFQRFIGSPMYSLILVLGGLLLFSGIGSFVSHYMKRKWQIIAVLAIPVILLLFALFIDGIFAGLSELGFTGKLVASALLIFPISFLMGIPFPNALDVIKKKASPEYGSLLFGISGTFATLGSACSMLFSVTWGFNMTFVIGMICYAAGIALFAKIVRYA